MTDVADDLLLHDVEDDVDEVSDVELGAVDDEDQLTGDEVHPADAPFARLRAAAERRREVKRLVMEVPGWEGNLLVEFGLLSRRDAKRLRSTTRGSRDDMMKVVADLLSVASRGLMEYDGSGEPVPLEHGGRRLMFADVHLFVPGTAQTERGGFFALFQEGPNRELNEAAIQAFSDRVGRWMADTSLQVDGAVDLTVNGAGEVLDEAVNQGS